MSCIIVGGGPAGLLAAARLADAGTLTTVLEARATLGGRAAGDHRAGFDLNQGPHALYAGGAAMRELRALGLDPPRWNPTSTTGSLLLRDGSARRAAGGPRTLAALARFSARLARGVDTEALATRSTTDWLEAELPDARARQVAAGMVRVATFVADHDTLSADVAATQLRLAGWPGVRYLRGGWQRLVDDLAMRARGSGAALQVRSAVTQVERDGDQWIVRTAEDEHRAGAVILAAGGPAVAARLLGVDIPAPGPAAEVGCLDVALSRLPRARRTFAFGVDAPTYFSRHSPPGHPGGVLLSVAGYERQPRADLEAVLDTVQPGWRERVTLAPRHLPRMVPVSAMATPARGGMGGRPPVEVPEAPGAFVAGDWAGGEGWMLDAALASAAAAAQAVLREVSVPVAA